MKLWDKTEKMEYHEESKTEEECQLQETLD